MRKLLILIIVILCITGCSRKEIISDELTNNITFSLIPLTEIEKKNIESIKCRNGENICTMPNSA